MTIITFNNLSRSDGSALIDQNDTVVQAAVFGPVDISQSKVNYEEAVVDILYKPKVSIPASSTAFDYVREVENLLRNVFKEVILTRLHPRTLISILIQEIYDGGFLLSACINAVCCALIDAGVPMKTPVAGITIEMEGNQMETNGESLIQESRTESKCKFDFVFDQNYEIITILTHGDSVNEDKLMEAIKLGRSEAKEIFEAIREKVKERFT